MGAEAEQLVEYIVVRPLIVVGSPVMGYSEPCESDLRRFAERKEAISHGFEQMGGDDFLIVTLVGGKVAAVGWVNDDRNPADPEEIARVAPVLRLGIWEEPAARDCRRRKSEKFNVRMTADTRAKLEALAAELERSMSGVVTQAVRELYGKVLGFVQADAEADGG